MPSKMNHNSSTKKRRRVNLLIFHKEHALLIHRIKKNQSYYVVPGGGIEAKETYKEAALRELQEETGLSSNQLTNFKKINTKIDDNVWFSMHSSVHEVNFTGPELDRMTKENIYCLLWVKYEDCLSLNIVPEISKRIMLKHFERQ